MKPSPSKLVFILIALMPFWIAQSAEIQINWQNMGSGGISTGGVYVLQGSIGQPCVSTSNGGAYTVTSGFWSITGVVQTPGAPFLNISLTNQNVLIYWQIAEKPYYLEQTQSLEQTPIHWSPVNATYWTNQNFIIITLPAVEGYRFFRLREK